MQARGRTSRLSETPAAMTLKIAFAASDAPVAQTARAALIARYGEVAEEKADVIVALGGDGFMLHTLHRTQALDLPVDRRSSV